MGFKTFGFAFGRSDIWAAEDDIYWGPENEWLGDQRYSGDRELANPLAAVQMGLIYVNPEGPNGIPDALASAQDIRETFSRMAMNDEETVALTIGGHTFGKMHGNGPAEAVGLEPEGAGLAEQGFGWVNTNETGVGQFAITSGLEGAWTPTPTKWDNMYLDTIFAHEWEVVESPAGAKQWQPREVKEGFMVPPVEPGAPETKPTMSTADMAMITDPAYLEISKRFHENPDQLADAFARAWFKLLHRDMGPNARYVGPQVPNEDLVWQDNVPAQEGALIGDAEIAELKSTILDSGLTVEQLVKTAWASASTYRRTDFRGGANGARIRLAPQADWDVNVQAGVGTVIAKLEEIQSAFNGKGGAQVSLADLIVLGGTAAVEAAAKAGGHDISVPFTPGRTDADQDSTDVESFQYLEPQADGFRNYVAKQGAVPTEHLLIDKAFMLNLSAPEMTALVGGLRVLGNNIGTEGHGVLTDRPGQLTTDFFTNLLDMDVKWSAVGEAEDVFEGRDRATGDRSGREPGWIWCSVPTASCGPSPRSTAQPAATSCSSTPSSPVGSRSWRMTSSISTEIVVLSGGALRFAAPHRRVPGPVARRVATEAGHTGSGQGVVLPAVQERENGGYRSVTSRVAYACTLSHQRATPTTKSNSGRGYRPVMMTTNQATITASTATIDSTNSTMRWGIARSHLTIGSQRFRSRSTSG